MKCVVCIKQEQNDLRLCILKLMTTDCLKIEQMNASFFHDVRASLCILSDFYME